jgi:hypothetical protein
MRLAILDMKCGTDMAGGRRPVAVTLVSMDERVLADYAQKVSISQQIVITGKIYGAQACSCSHVSTLL